MYSLAVEKCFVAVYFMKKATSNLEIIFEFECDLPQNDQQKCLQQKTDQSQKHWSSNLNFLSPAHLFLSPERPVCVKPNLWRYLSQNRH